MTHITPRNWTKYRGFPVTLRREGKTPVTGTLVNISSLGTKIRLEDERVVIRKGYIVTVQMMTVAQVAELFNMKPIALRHQLRKHGASVGKGQKYSFDPVDVQTIREWLEEGA